MPCRSSVRRARPGEPVNLTLFFHADEVPSADLGFNLFTPYLPTTRWAAGDILRFVLPACLPADAEGQYQFTVNLDILQPSGLLLQILAKLRGG